ncbi:glycosyltransferase family 2 protein [Aliiroseovarius sp. KMU-50]|uniref:Glycosyltransferase family 2 protein n=1 Tax=Aliiroseovarius salicola TaxID=3009082 RepID=A0ABT4W1J9_9RHOB|nr:glycosyltransferase family 2 protein [Aliiroseovarius sp. KMU-50]MDA5094341.1 glycosyltransferase family 2 protein [Aliiroseovarius sp. KMU-50]
MQSNVAVVTTCRDDEFFLERWVKYYGDLFGKEALYVINHGNQELVRRVAEGCNLFPIPDNQRRSFNPLRWRTQNALLTALRQWYRHVIVCDVDEFIVVDPKSGKDLKTWLDVAKSGAVYTPLGLDITHVRDREPEGIENSILGPRRHAVINPWYNKPCIVSRPAQLSRGGHYSTFDGFRAPKFLYLFHMKRCDFGLFSDTMNRRNDMVESMGVSDVSDTTTNKQWFVENRKDEAEFAGYEAREVDESWDFSGVRRRLKKSFRPRKDTKFYESVRETSPNIFKLPERFSGIC